MRTRGIVLGLIWVCAAAASADASVIDYSVWESRVLGADSIAIVECERAGYSVARFRVVESWKGSYESGKLLTLERRALVGQRFLLAFDEGRALAPAYLPGGYGPGSCVVQSARPVEWRRFLVDGRRCVGVSLPTTPHGLESAFRAPHKKLAEFKRAVVDFVRQPEAEQRRRTLLGLARRHLPKPQRELVMDRLKRAGTPAELIATLLTCRKSLSPSVLDVILGVGWVDAEAVLQVTPGEEKRLERLRKRSARWAIADKRSEPSPADRHHTKKVRTQLLEHLYRSLFGGRLGRRTFSLELLERDLAKGVLGIGSKAHSLGDSNYLYASTLCALYPEGRTDFLRRLLRATDPWARTAGAVYLLPLSHAEAHAALEGCAKIPGEPGAWAALTLARLGQASAVQRVLDLEGREEAGASLRARLLPLLSNAARAARAPAPPLLNLYSHTPADQEKLRAWWEANQVRVGPHLRDPWLEELAGQRVE